MVFYPYIIYEYLKGSGSQFYNYFQNFYKDYSFMPIFYDDELLERFQDKNFIKQVKLEKV